MGVERQGRARILFFRAFVLGLLIVVPALVQEAETLLSGGSP